MIYKINILAKQLIFNLKFEFFFKYIVYFSTKEISDDTYLIFYEIIKIIVI